MRIQARLAFVLALLFAAIACGPGRPIRAPAAASSDTGWVSVPGGRLFYEVAGRGQVLALIHGGFGDRRMWDEQFSVLAEHFRVVRYDHRGFGRSIAPDSAYSPVADLERLLDHLGVERAHLMGNSMGGALALDFALVRPERTRKVIVIASGANGYPFEEADGESVMAVFRAAQREGVDSAASLWLAHPMVAVTSADPAAGPRLSTMVRENRGIFLLRHWPDEALDPPTYERLAELQTPVLFIQGARDMPLVLRVASATAARVPGARTVVVPGADHLPQMSMAAEVNRIVLEFLRP